MTRQRTERQEIVYYATIHTSAANSRDGRELDEILVCEVLDGMGSRDAWVDRKLDEIEEAGNMTRLIREVLRGAQRYA